MSNMLLRGNISYQQRARLHAQESHLGKAKAPHATPLNFTAHKRNNPHSGVIHGHGSVASGHYNQTNNNSVANAMEWASTMFGGAGAATKAVNMAANANRDALGRFRAGQHYLKSVEKAGKVAQKAGRAGVGRSKEVATKVATGVGAVAALGAGVFRV